MSMQAELNRFEKSIEHLSSPQLISLYQNFPKDPKNTDMYYQKLTIIGRRNLLLQESRSLPFSVTDLPLVKKTQPRLLLATSYYVAKPVSNERVKSALALIQESSSCLSISAERHQAPFAIRAFRAPTRVLQEPLALFPCNPTPPEASHAPRFLQAEPKVGRFLLRVLQEPIKAATTPQTPPQKPEAVPTIQAPVFSCNPTPPEATQALLQEPLALGVPEALLQEPLALRAPSASQRFLLFLIFFLLVFIIFWFNAVEVPQEFCVDPSSRIIEIAAKNINKNV